MMMTPNRSEAAAGRRAAGRSRSRRARYLSMKTYERCFLVPMVHFPPSFDLRLAVRWHRCVLLHCASAARPSCAHFSEVL
jgi:hypothetical protein